MGLSTLFTIGVQPNPVDPLYKIVSLLPWETATLGLGLYKRTIANALKIVMGGNREWDKVAKEVVWSEKEAIRHSFQVALPKYKWMDKQTNSEAQKKLAAVLATSGYNPSIMDPERLAYRYLPIDPKPGTFMTNVLEAQVASFKYKLGRVDEKVDRREAEYPVTAANAYY
ncbi:hypothetical protein HDU98_010867, partial [Podochytrium sp. JEL0797]